MNNKSETNCTTMSNEEYKDIEKDLRYLRLLAQSFPTVEAASTEVINLEAIRRLPKGTEHFIADIHGEWAAFQHVLRNASGNVRRKVNEIFGSELRESEKRDLCTLIYYPEEKIELVKQREDNIDDWYSVTMHQIVRVCRDVSSKYTRSKVRKALPKDYAYIIEELLHESNQALNKTEYVKVIIDTIISTGRADDFITALCRLIQRLIIDRLHILGDIYDRGPGAHLIMDLMERQERWDIQWGNHDILWMGACAGNDACICNVIRLSLRYGNLNTIEEGYGINLVPLATFAMQAYKDDQCAGFMPKDDGGSHLADEKTRRLTAQMHKAIAVMQLKAEASIIRRHPEWTMDDRLLLSSIDYSRHVCHINGKDYDMTSCNFPTIDPQRPEAFSNEESDIMAGLRRQFTTNEKLRRHIDTLLSHGCVFTVANHNLLFHASVPLNADGTLMSVHLYDGDYKGRDLLHRTGMLIRAAFQKDTEQSRRAYARDYFLYLWCGPHSTFFDKSKMATFERYFLRDKATWNELKGNYFLLRDNPQVIDRILDEFGVTGPDRHIINGHVPVHAASGENPVKAGGKLMVIDGGFSQAYHKETGIAGYTLVFHSRGFELVQHEPFTSKHDAVTRGTDIKGTTQIVEMAQRRMLVADTDAGEDMKRQIIDLKKLLYAYRHGLIKEKR